MESFSFGISSLLLWLIETTKYITLLICLIFVIKALTWKKLPAWWHYGIWLLLVLRMIMPWVPESRLSMFNYVPVLKNQIHNSPALKENAFFVQIFIDTPPHLLALKDQGLLEGTVDISPNDDPKHGFWPDLTLNQILLLVWLSGIIGVCLCVVFKNLSFWIVVRKRSPITDQGILDQFEACKKQMRVRTEVSLIITSKVKSPALFGYIHPRLLLPEGILERLDQDKLRYVFLHELAHLKRHDIAISWLVTVLQALHWFNPFVWYAFYQMRIDQEIACDAYVLSQLERDQSTRYAHTLVGLLECFLENRNVPALTGILESRSRIRRRIITIVQNKQYSKTLTLSAVTLFLVLGFTFFTTAKRASTEPNEQQEIIDSQAIAMEGASPKAMTRYDSSTPKVEKLMQETEDKSRTELSVPFSNNMAMNDIPTQPIEMTPHVEGIQKLTEDLQIAENELTRIVRDVQSEADQPTANRQQVEEKIQTVITTNTQKVSNENTFKSSEQSMILKEATVAGDELGTVKKDDLISEQKSDIVQEAKIEDKGTKDSGDTEGIPDEIRMLTSMDKPDPSIGITYAYPAVLFQNRIDESITTTSLFHYLEESGHPTLYSQEGERVIEETKTSSVVVEDSDHLVNEEEPSGKKPSDSFRIDEPPKMLSKGPLTYPFRAKRLGISGKISVSCLVDTDGHATNIEAVRAEPAHALMTFAKAAEETIAQCRFKPGTSAGEPVPVKVMVPIIFEI